MAGSGNAHLRDSSLFRVEDLVVTYPGPVGRVQAVSGVSIDVQRHETLGIVGESGCGKSTMARAILQLQPVDSGAIIWDGVDLTRVSSEDLRSYRRQMQIVFQDPIASLNPRRRVNDIVAEPFVVWGAPELGTTEQRVEELLEAVGLSPSLFGSRRPHEMSGGQCQRVSIARALALEPSLLVCDEVVSSLDVSIQAQILNLLASMADRFGLAMIFIAHDLAVVRHISNRIAVMFLGRLCEVARADDLYTHPRHPYTVALLAAAPSLPAEDPLPWQLNVNEGEPPSNTDPPSGCRFRTRCPYANDVCSEMVPIMRRVGEDHFVACHHPVG